jgi:signal transduction histidine kinase
MPLSMARLPSFVSVACGTYAVIGGVITLLGWAVGAERLTSWIGDGISMFPNTAVAAVLCGCAVLLTAIRPKAAVAWLSVRLSAGLVGLLGGVTLVQHIFGVNLGLDTLLFERAWGQRAAAAPMRMGPPASTSYVVLGVALVLATLGPRGRRIGSALALVPIGIASLSLTGFWFGADPLFGAARFTGIAFQTSTIIFALGVGLLAAVPEHGLTNFLRRRDAGGVLARRLLLPIIAIPVGLGKLCLVAQRAGMFDTQFGLAVFVLATVAMLLVLLWWTARGVSRQSRLAIEAERAVRESEARLKAILEQLPVAVGVMDTGGAWVLTNPRMAMYAPTALPLASSGGSARLRAWDDVGEPISPEDWPARRALRGERVAGLEMLYTAEDGRDAWVRCSAAPLTSDSGKIVGATCVVQDIDLSKRFQDRLQEELAKRTEEVNQAAQSLALAQRLAAVGTMAAGLAHDINNITLPLGARMDVLLQNPALEEKIKRELAVITALVDHLRQMSRNLSLFSRDPEQDGAEGSTDLASWSHRVRGLLEASLGGLPRAHGDAGVRLRFDLPPGLPLVRVAPHRLTQAVLNIAHNSRDAIIAARALNGWQADRGCITIRARAREDRAAVVLEVIDDGCGMDDQTRRRAVEPFFTTKHRPLAAGSAGSGLGLALAHAICERVGGRLEIASELGKGTTVAMTLPTGEAAEPDIVVGESVARRASRSTKD